MKPKRKDFSFAKFFRPSKSPQPRLYGVVPNHISVSKSREFVIWESQRDGTYIRAVHGPLKKLSHEKT